MKMERRRDSEQSRRKEGMRARMGEDLSAPFSGKHKFGKFGAKFFMKDLAKKREKSNLVVLLAGRLHQAT